MRGSFVAKHSSSSSNDACSWDVTVFDTGRCSSRQGGDPPSTTKEGESSSSSSSSSGNNNPHPLLSQYTYDHAAHFLALPPNDDCYKNEENTSTAPVSIYQEFHNQATQWEQDGIVAPFPPDSIWTIHPRKKIEETNANGSGKNSTQYYFGTHARHRLDSRNNGRTEWGSLSPAPGRLGISIQWRSLWRVQVNGRVYGTFDHLVIAHNGKCAHGPSPQ